MRVVCANVILQEGGKGAVRAHERFCSAATATAMQVLNMVLLHAHAVCYAEDLHSAVDACMHVRARRHRARY